MTGFAEPPPPEDPNSTTRTATVNLRADTTAYAASMAQAQQQTSAVASAVESLSTKATNLTRSLGRGMKITALADFGSLTAATASAATFQKELSTLSATAAVTGTGLGAIKSSVEQATTAFPVSRGEVVQLTTAISNMGVTGARDLGSLTRTFIKLGASTGESMTGLASGLVQLSRQMGNTSSGAIGNYANSLLTVSRNAGVSASGVLEFAQAIAPMARQAGIGQAAVLGISTAFNRAGADGYVAANTFNTLINSITQLSRTGSPELVKYANFVGKTAAEFKKLPAKEQISELFKGIAAGGPKSTNFVNDLGLGIRAQSAVAAVAQGGGIDKFIGQAEGASHDQKNLNKGAHAAFDNLADNLVKLRNQFSQLADVIGGPLLRPLSLLVTGLSKAFGALNTVIKDLHLKYAIDALALLAGTLLTLGGAVLAHGLIGKLGTVALLRMGANSGPAGAAREGFAAGKAERTARAEGFIGPMPVGRYGAMNAEEGAPLRTRAAYGAGERLGGFFSFGRRRGAPAAATEPQSPSGAGQAAAAAKAEGAASTARQAATAAARVVPLSAAGLFKMQARSMDDSRQRDPLKRSAYDVPTGRAPDIGVKERLAALRAENKAEAESASVIGAAGRAAGKASIAFIDLTAATVKAGVSAGAAGVRMAGGAAFGVGGAGPVGEAEKVAGVGGKLAGVGGKIGGALFSLPGMLAMMAAPTIIGMAGDLMKGPKKDNSDLSGYLNPVKGLNDALGIATTNLTSFADKLKDARDNLPTNPGNQTDLTRATTVTGADMAKYQNAKTTDKNVKALTTKTGKGSWGGESRVQQTVANAVALGRSYDMSDPRSLASYKDQLISAGYTHDQVQAVLHQLTSGNKILGSDTANLTTIGTAAAGLTDKITGYDNAGNPKFGHHAPDEAKALVGAGATAIGTRFDRNLTTHSASYATATKLQGLLQLGSPLATNVVAAPTGGSSGSAEELASLVATVTGGKTSDYASFDAHGSGNYQLRTKVGSDTTQTIVTMLKSTKEGRDLLKSAGLTDKNITPAKLQQFIAANANAPAANPSALAGTVQGQAVMANKSFQDVTIGQKIGDPAALYRTSENLVKAMGQMTPQLLQRTMGGGTNITPNLSRVSGQLMGMSDLVGADSTQGQVLAGAATQARIQQSFQMPFMSRAQRTATINANLQGSTEAMQGPNPSTGTVEQYKADVQARQQDLQSQAQFAQQMYQQVQQYNTQMARAAQDESHSEFIAKRNFYIQMQQANWDYQKNTMRSRQDFAKSERRQAEDASKSIYNPFMRVQAVYTATAGTLVQNLRDQNARIKKQQDELHKLRQEGLSQQAIDQLQLSDPNNAQQLNTVVGGVTNNPGLINQINRAVGTRVSATTSLTQSSFNQTFRRTIADFTLGLNRAAEDYKIAHDRAVKAQDLALSDMSYAYNQMVKRSGQDLRTSMKELYGSFGDVFAGSLNKQLQLLGHFAPKAAKLIQTQLDALKKANGLTPITPADPGTATNTGDRPKPGHVPKPSASSSGHGVAGGRKLVSNAEGGVSVGPQLSYISEWAGNAQELHVPLNRSDHYTVGLAQQIAKTTIMLMHTAPHPTMPRGAATNSTVITSDHSTNFTGAVTVEASDPNEMARKLKAKERLNRLSHPQRHH